MKIDGVNCIPTHNTSGDASLPKSARLRAVAVLSVLYHAREQGTCSATLYEKVRTVVAQEFPDTLRDW